MLPDYRGAAMLELNHVQFSFPGVNIATHFEVERGKSVALMGGSGSGKTTILNLIAGFLSPDQGDILFDGISLLTLKPSERPLTYLFQAHNLFPHLTVAENLGLGLNPGLRLSGSDQQKISAALEWVEMEGFERRLPTELSGGQQQRVALGRCLLRQKPVLLLDEPFSALDRFLRSELSTLINTLQREQSLCIVVATHQLEDATALDAEIVRVG
jgi:thiamine transport system ATP-binding protein